MTLPFSTAAFLQVFRDYNVAIWPAQILGLILGLAALAALFQGRDTGVRIVMVVLAVLWTFVGIGYHLMFFARINPVAPAFAALCLAQAVLFQASAIWPKDLQLVVRPNLRSTTGLSVILYGVLVYPILGQFEGHGGMAGPMFGVAPCPTTIFTIGLLIVARGAWVVWLSILPILWSLIGMAAAFQMDIPEDLGLPLASAALVWTLIATALQGRRAKSSPPGSVP